MSTVQKGTVSKGTVSKGNIFPSELAFSGELTSVITSGGSVSVNENVDADTAVYTATARDRNGVTSGFSFAISTGDSSAFTINSSTGVVTIDASPNFEAQSSYSFTVTATKSGQPTATKNVTILVNNLDEVAPVIQSNAIYSGSHLVGATTPIGTVLHTAVATDTGDGTNGNVTYQVTSQYDNAFAIDANTGVLTLASQPGSGGSWSASYSQNNCTITALDDAGNVSSAQTIDFRGVGGIVIQGGTINAVSESITNSSPFHTLNLTTGTKSDTDFFMISDPSGLFTVVEDGADGSGYGGALFLESGSNLDYETATSHTITVQGVHKTYPLVKSAVTTITIPVSDVQPIITSGGTVTSIVENSGANQTIYTATATDADPQGNNTFTFSIVNSDSSAISINSTTGVVTLADNPDYETKDTYNFTVVATNAQGNSASQVLQLSINFDGLVANGTLGRYNPTGGYIFKGYDDSATANQPYSHTGSLSPTSDSNFYSGAAVKNIGYGVNQYSSASGTEFRLSIAGDRRNSPGFELVITDKNNVSRTFRSTDSNMYNESYNSFNGLTSYYWDVVDTDAQAEAIFKQFTGITSMVVGEKYTADVIPYGAHSSGSPGTGNNPSSDRGQALLSIGGNHFNNSFYGIVVTANSNITNSTNITNAQDIQFSTGGTADLAAGDANGTGESFSITLKEL